MPTEVSATVISVMRPILISSKERILRYFAGLMTTATAKFKGHKRARQMVHARDLDDMIDPHLSPHSMLDLPDHQ